MSTSSDDITVTLSFGGMKISLILKKSYDQKSYLPFESMSKQTITNNNIPPGCKNSVSVRHNDNTPGILADLECFSVTLKISLTCELTKVRGMKICRYRIRIMIEIFILIAKQR